MENTRDSCAVREKNMNTMRLWPDGPLYAEAKHMPITTDSILLADFAVVHSGEKGADLGCASGLLMLMLLWREKGLRMTGLELLPEAVQLAEENLRANGLQERAELVCGDLRETAGKLPNGRTADSISLSPILRTIQQKAGASLRTKRAAAQEGRRLSVSRNSAGLPRGSAAAGDGYSSATVRSGLFRSCRRCGSSIWSQRGSALSSTMLLLLRRCCSSKDARMENQDSMRSQRS